MNIKAHIQSEDPKIRKSENQKIRKSTKKNEKKYQKNSSEDPKFVGAYGNSQGTVLGGPKMRTLQKTDDVGIGFEDEARDGLSEEKTHEPNGAVPDVASGCLGFLRFFRERRLTQGHRPLKLFVPFQFRPQPLALLFES